MSLQMIATMRRKSIKILHMTSIVLNTPCTRTSSQLFHGSGSCDCFYVSPVTYGSCLQFLTSFERTARCLFVLMVRKCAFSDFILIWAGFGNRTYFGWYETSWMMSFWIGAHSNNTVMISVSILGVVKKDWW